MRSRVAFSLPVAWLCAVLLLVASPVDAQSPNIPDSFTNLQVLPKDISKADLVATMRRVSGALGVRCDYCHARADQAPGLDFASDQKDAKQVARTMMRMVATINADYLGKLPVGEGHPPSVTCYTCHHSASEPPAPLDDLLFEVATTKSAAAAVDRYKSLRGQLAEAGQYDFRETTLLRVGARLVEQKRFDDGLVVYRAAADLFPASANVQASIGQASLDKGDLAAAEAAFKRALEIEPGHRGATQGLKALEAKRQAK